jgi:hypothetical protein
LARERRRSNGRSAFSTTTPPSATIAFCVVTQLAAVPIFFIVGRWRGAQLTDEPT